MIEQGNVCRNTKNDRLGVVNRHQGTGLRTYYGVGFDGEPWQASQWEVAVVAKNINEYIARQVVAVVMAGDEDE